jgi:hypothetical protein
VERRLPEEAVRPVPVTVARGNTIETSLQGTRS